MSKPVITITFKRKEAYDCDSTPDLEDTASNYKGCAPEEIARYVAQDLERLKAYRNGEWHFVGIRAIAIVRIDRGNYRTSYTLESPGLWGIEDPDLETAPETQSTPERTDP